VLLSNNTIGLNRDVAIDNVDEIEVSKFRKFVSFECYAVLQSKINAMKMEWLESLAGLFAKFIVLIIQKKRRSRKQFIS